MRYAKIVAPLNRLIIMLLLFPAISAAEWEKPANCSGTFYPAEPTTLARQVDDFIARIPPDTGPHAPVCGVLVPHAGYIYSGKTAAAAYARLRPQHIRTIILLGQSHYHHFAQTAVYDRGFFLTPLGKVAIDEPLAEKILRDIPEAAFLPEVFEQEHCLEVHLPFIQRTLPETRIVPILLGQESYVASQKLAAVLTALLQKNPDVVLLVSSDLSHYHPQKQAITLDRATLSLIESLQPQKLFTELQPHPENLCAYPAVTTLLLTMLAVGADRSEELAYATSADSPEGNSRNVVGYSAVVFTKPEMKGGAAVFSDEHKQFLLTLARESITHYLNTQEVLPLSQESIPEPLRIHRGAFVTLTEQGRLRGCIGRILPDMPLTNVIRDMAVEAAIHDPRFPAVHKKELPDIRIELSVLSEFELITDSADIIIGTHGLMIQKDSASGVLLPQVAEEYGWNAREFLEQTCLKAGIPKDSWKQANIYRFSATVFSEERE